MEEHKNEREDLAMSRMKEAALNKTIDWDINDLDIVLKHLKKDKSTDALGYINEIFKPEVIGSDLKLAILKLMNKIKNEQIFPKCLELCNITSIFKKKGSKSDFNNYRGVFRALIFRTILERLIYNDEYPNIDMNLTDANVGARKKRNIRDNLFVIYAVMNSVISGSEDPLDICPYDIEKCFDALWTHECINDLYEAGLTNDKLPLLFKMNMNAQVAIKTSQGITERTDIKNIIMQGSVWGSLSCTSSMDKLPQRAYTNEALQYKYKGEVVVPPLGMVDDIITIQKCGTASVTINSEVNAFVEQKKLTLSTKKCTRIHVGKKCNECEVLYVHQEVMVDSDEVKYLGDILHKNGKIKATVAKRINQGYARVGQIFALLKDLPLGNLRIRVGLELRQAWLINGILYNSEVWHGLRDIDIANFVAIDKYLLRGIINSHAKVPIEHLYLEMGVLPLAYVISARRLIYLQTILKRPESDPIMRAYIGQKEN